MTPAALLDTTAAIEAPAVPAAAEAPPAAPNLVVPVLHNLGLLVVMRTAETVIWPDPFARTQYFGAHYEEAFTKPPIFDWNKPAFEWDGDPWYVNTIGHGLFGSELYLRGRTCRVPWYGAVAFAAAGSTLWEYAFEGNGVRPSALDLVYTPLMGAVLGETRFLVWKAAGAIEARGARSVVRAIVDPLGEAERALGVPC